MKKKIHNQLGLVIVETTKGAFNIECNDATATLRNSEGDTVESVKFCSLLTSNFKKNDAVRYLIDKA